MMLSEAGGKVILNRSLDGVSAGSTYCAPFSVLTFSFIYICFVIKRPFW